MEHANSLGRVLFTQDIRFKALAESWQNEGKIFAGLIFGHQLHGSIGQYIRDLELIAKATDSTDRKQAYPPCSRNRAQAACTAAAWAATRRSSAAWLGVSNVKDKGQPFFAR